LLHPLCLSQFVYQMRKITALKVADKNDEKLKINNGLKNFANSSFKFCSQQRQLVWFHLSLSLSLSPPHTHKHTLYLFLLSLSVTHTSTSFTHFLSRYPTLSILSLLYLYISLLLSPWHTHTLSQAKIVVYKMLGIFSHGDIGRIKKIFFAAKEKKDSAFQKKTLKWKIIKTKIMFSASNLHYFKLIWKVLAVIFLRL